MAFLTYFIQIGARVNRAWVRDYPPSQSTADKELSPQAHSWHTRAHEPPCTRSQVCTALPAAPSASLRSHVSHCVSATICSLCFRSHMS